jgi:EAL domain-containing protein (putative c-di-GMP-specific phosphodiesterase class I)
MPSLGPHRCRRSWSTSPRRSSGTAISSPRSRARLEASGLAADRLVLEINEDVLLDAPDQAVPVFNGLRARGIGIALDDFGTGRSSLNLLQSFTFDRIKIDQRLIAETTRDPGAATIARAIIAAGRAMGARITAEGVDSDQKLAFLMQAGCDEVQGFYFDRPLPNAGIRRMIELIDAHRSTPIWSSAAEAAPEEVRA